MESKGDCLCLHCWPTNLPSGPGVIKMWWLKANVRSYVELSSAIREDYCHRLDLKTDGGERTAEQSDSEGGLRGEQWRGHNGKTSWMSECPLDILNVYVMKKLHACRVVTGWRLQHKDFKLHWSTLVAEGVTLFNICQSGSDQDRVIANNKILTPWWPHNYSP